jgi:hypothetical protein
VLAHNSFLQAETVESLECFVSSIEDAHHSAEDFNTLRVSLFDLECWTDGILCGVAATIWHHSCPATHALPRSGRDKP